MAGQAQRPTRWWLAWRVAVLLTLTGIFTGSGIASLVVGTDRTAAIYQYGEAFPFAITMILLLLWVRVKERRPTSSVGLRGANPVGKLLLGFLAGGAMMSIAVAIMWSTGLYATPLLVLFLFRGTTEKVVFRSYMLPVGARLISGLAAIIGTSVIFAVLHGALSPVPLLNLTLFAVFACFVALGQGSLWLIAGLHGGWNYFQGNIVGVAVSGGAQATSLFSFGPATGSSDLLTGGTFGVEGGLICTAVLTVALVIAIAGFRRAQAGRELQPA